MATNGQLDFRLRIHTLELTTTATGYVTRILDTFDIGRSDIEYRAEGNANIVLAIPQRCQVLRLPKFVKSEQNSCSPTSAHNDDSYKRIFHVYKYSASTSALFERNFSTHPILVRLEFHNASAFDVWLHNRRPLNRIRQHTAEEHFDFEHGLLYRDACSLKINLESTKLLHTAGDVIAVEIKPKQGWNICSLSGSLLNLLGIDEPRRLKCRFCAMQFLKMQGNAVKRMSKYCPMDLFSGNLSRTQDALRNLIESPQNNFRVFVNGSLIYCDANRIEDLQMMLASYFGKDAFRSTDAFISLLSRILYYDFINSSELKSSQPKPHNQLQSNVNVCVQRDTCEHSTGSILKSVRAFQLLSQDAIRDIATKYITNSTEFNDDRRINNGHINELCAKLNAFEPTTGQVSFDYFANELHLTTEQIYEIGATTLDCSIMLTFGKVDNTQRSTSMTPILYADNESYAINATVFDLDPKLYTKHFRKYVEKTKESYHAVGQYSLL